MNVTILSVAASNCLLASSTLAHASCSTAFTDKFTSTERLVDSLRPDKAG